VSIRANDYSAERRHRDRSRATGLQFWACHAITAEAMAEALQQSAADYWRHQAAMTA